MEWLYFAGLFIIVVATLYYQWREAAELERHHRELISIIDSFAEMVSEAIERQESN